MSLLDYQSFLNELEGLKVESSIAAGGDKISNLNDMDELPSRSDANPFDLCMRAELNGILSDAVRLLSDREQSVIDLYYRQDQTMGQIALTLGLTVGRISQIHSCAVMHLRQLLSG